MLIVSPCIRLDSVIYKVLEDGSGELASLGDDFSTVFLLHGIRPRYCMQVQWRGLFRFFLPNIRCVSVPYIGGFGLTLRPYSPMSCSYCNIRHLISVLPGGNSFLCKHVKDRLRHYSLPVQR